MPAAAGRLGVVDEINRIGGAGILGVAGIVVVGNARYRIEDDVFQHAAEANGIVNLRLSRGG